MSFFVSVSVSACLFFCHSLYLCLHLFLTHKHTLTHACRNMSTFKRKLDKVQHISYWISWDLLLFILCIKSPVSWHSNPSLHEVRDIELSTNFLGFVSPSAAIKLWSRPMFRYWIHCTCFQVRLETKDVWRPRDESRCWGSELCTGQEFRFPVPLVPL